MLTVKPSAEEGNQELEVEIPAAAPEGCFVPVYVQREDAPPSNIVTMAIRRGPGPCQFPPGFPVPLLTGRRVGVLVLSRLAGLSGNGRERWTDDDALAAFAEKPAGPALTPLLLAPPPGTCTGYTGSSESSMSFPVSISAALLNQLGERGLDAGEALEVRGPKGGRSIPTTPGARGYYRVPLGSDASRRRPLFLEPGSYQVASGGGRDVGPFSLELRAADPFEWTNRENFPEIRRDQPLTLTWSIPPHDRTMLLLAAQRRSGQHRSRDALLRG